MYTIYRKSSLISCKVLFFPRLHPGQAIAFIYTLMRVMHHGKGPPLLSNLIGVYLDLYPLALDGDVVAVQQVFAQDVYIDLCKCYYPMSMHKRYGNQIILWTHLYLVCILNHICCDDVHSRHFHRAKYEKFIGSSSYVTKLYTGCCQHYGSKTGLSLCKHTRL